MSRDALLRLADALEDVMCGGVIVDDSFRHISLMLDSDIDRERPMTEIVVQEV